MESQLLVAEAGHRHTAENRIHLTEFLGMLVSNVRVDNRQLIVYIILQQDVTSIYKVSLC